MKQAKLVTHQPEFGVLEGTSQSLQASAGGSTNGGFGAMVNLPAPGIYQPNDADTRRFCVIDR